MLLPTTCLPPCRAAAGVSMCLSAFSCRLSHQYWASCNYWFGFPESKVHKSLLILIPPFSLEIFVISKWDAAAQQQHNPSFKKLIPTKSQTASFKAKSFTFYQPVVVITPLNRRPVAVWTDTLVFICSYFCLNWFEIHSLLHEWVCARHDSKPKSH